MIRLGAWLASLLPKITREILIALQFGFLAFVGLDVFFTTLIDRIPYYFSGIPSDMLLLMNVAGFGDALNIIFAAISARISYYLVTKAKVIKWGNG